MSIHIGGKKIKDMYWAGLKIREAWYEGRRVFSGKPVEVMPATPGDWDAYTWLREKVTEYGESYETVTELPFEIDSSQATKMASMFERFSALTVVPAMDTSRVTDMSGMFDGCSSLTTVPEMNTSRVTDMSGMFRGCSSLTSVPAMDTSQVTRMRQMFDGCSSLTDGNVRLIGKHRQVDTGAMINRSGLTREPFYDINGQPI